MKYFFDPILGVRAFESDSSQDFLITPEMHLLTAEEVQVHLNPVPTAEQLQARINTEARTYLASTDWYVIRWQENGTPIPEDIATARAEARANVIGV